MEAEELQRNIQAVEFAAEELLLARRQLVEADKARNGNREALTALRKQARTSKSSLFHSDGSDPAKCPTCGDSDGSRPIWNLSPGADVFFRLPFHVVHTNLEKAQVEAESEVKKHQSTVKEKTFILSEKGAIADVVNPSIVESFVKLKA